MKKLLIMILVLTLAMSSMVFAEDATTTTETAASTETTTETTTEAAAPFVPADGTYTIEVTSRDSMFRVVNAVLTSSNGTMSAVITLSGDGYPKLYMGTIEEAAANDSDSISYVPDSEGKYTFTIPVSALDTPITLAAYSTKKEIWYDRQITFNSNTLAKISTGTPDIPDTNNDFIVVNTDGNGNKTASINASSDTSVTIPASSFSTIAGGTLSISTALGIVTFDAEAIAGFTGKAAGDATLTVQNVSSNTAYKDSGYDMVISLALRDAAGNAIFAEGSNGKATITVPYTHTVASGKTVKVYYVTASGKEPVDAVYNAANHTITFTVAHFSDYAIVQEAAAPVTGDRNVAAMVIFFLIISGAVILRFTYTKKESL